jgi:hypothetical protein
VAALFYEKCKMYLHTGWKMFACDNDVQVGCLVNFFYKGDGEMSVKLFGKESCCIHYQSDSGDDKED